MLVPTANAAEARQASGGLEITPVTSLADAISLLG
jgi:hypothetical protein